MGGSIKLSPSGRANASSPVGSGVVAANGGNDSGRPMLCMRARCSTVEVVGSLCELESSRGAGRAASVVCCREDVVELIKIDKDSYDRILKREATRWAKCVV